MTKINLTERIAQNAIIAAIYFLLTIITTPFSYGAIQFRIAEMLVLLCFYRPDFVVGVTLGCLVSNFNSTLGPWDILIGTTATLVSSLLIAYASPRLLVAAIYPIVFNAFIVGGELYWLTAAPFWISVAFVAIGEASCVFVSYFILLGLLRRKSFLALIKAERHLSVLW
jgi:uncharacterized membrane protein